MKEEERKTKGPLRPIKIKEFIDTVSKSMRDDWMGVHRRRESTLKLTEDWMFAEEAHYSLQTILITFGSYALSLHVLKDEAMSLNILYES